MKCRASRDLQRNNRLFTDSQIEKACEEVFDEQYAKVNYMMVTQIAVVLNKFYGFWNKRLVDFFGHLQEVQDAAYNKYELDKEDLYNFCDMILERNGIKLEGLLEKKPKGWIR